MNKQIDIEDCIDFGVWLHRYRMKKVKPWGDGCKSDYSGYSLIDVSKATGIGKGRLEAIEKNGRSVRVWEFKALMGYFKIDNKERERLFEMI